MNGDQVLIDAPAERPCTHQRVHHHHGTLGRYVSDRCRCRPCRDAHTAYHRDRTTQLAHGSWQKYADAEPVRQHLRQLMSAGLWQTTIAARSGVGLATIARLLRTKGHPSESAPARRQLCSQSQRAPQPPGQPARCSP